MIAQHAVDSSLETAAHLGHCVETRLKGTKRLPPIISRQDADVISDFPEKFHEPPHRSRVHVRVKVAEMKDCEPIEVRWKVRAFDEVLPDLDPLGVLVPAPVESRQLEEHSNPGLDRIPIFRVKKIYA